MPTAEPFDMAVARLNASLRAIQRDIEKELTSELRRIGNEARDVVRGSNKPPYRTGRTRKGIKTSVRRKTEVALVSNLPQAPVWEFGGTIKPRGVPIEIPTTNFVRGPVLELSEDIDERIADAFDEVVHRHGFL